MILNMRMKRGYVQAMEKYLRMQKELWNMIQIHAKTDIQS